MQRAAGVGFVVAAIGVWNFGSILNAGLDCPCPQPPASVPNVVVVDNSGLRVLAGVVVEILDFPTEVRTCLLRGTLIGRPCNQHQPGHGQQTWKLRAALH